MSSINPKDAAERLKTFGIDISDSDMTVIELAAAGVEEYILNYCNISVIPPELYYTAVDMCCGTFLRTKLSTGQLEGMTEGALSSITEGDMSMSFREDTSPAEAFNKVINKLTDKKGELECFRRLKW